ncbi:unnamed protein product (mitochondrion) [Plasmodiophora brassicae]|uniref:Cullin family profile domain-containing protein n=1 Tax=Plasmodiophora brassicae TaxID=37360 RepID=A0A3P3Y5X2_PLABS|nr:unnamed protein product [Plasmodiophora brassicae]
MSSSGSGGGPGFTFNHNDMTLEQAQAIWSLLRKGIMEIQNGNASTLRYEELYRNAYTLVLHKHGPLLYDGVAQTILDKLESIAQTKIDNASDDQLLRVLTAEWEKHKLIMTMIRDVLMYMDKTFCERDSRIPVFAMGINLFRTTIIGRGSCPEKLQSVLLRSIYRERHHEVIEQDLIKHCLAMLVECGNCPPDHPRIYEEYFEKQFLEETRQFYRRESAEFISQNTVPDYLRKIEMRLNEEDSRADHYLHDDTKPKLRAVCHDELITNYAQTLVDNPNTGCVFLLEHSMIDDLHRMYILFKRVPSTLAIVSDCMKSLVRQVGEAYVADPENKKNPCKFVQSVLDLRAKFYGTVEKAFDGDRSFARSLKEAFEHFINIDSRAAQYLSLYIDGMLKKGLRAAGEDEIEMRLEEIVTIFRLITDKDVFEEFYKIHLASRLLTRTQASDDVEKSMIAKLKAECGHQFTSKLEGMFKNIDLSTEINRGFQLWFQGASAGKGPQIYVNVLTSGFWPFPESPPCALPQLVASTAEMFASFYRSKHAGHKITWQTSLGTAELQARFNKGKKELIVHTYQMCILMLFNNNDKHLLSLAHPKVKVLLKSPNTKKIEPDHMFMYNTEYTSCLYRIKIPLLAAASEAAAVQEQPVPPAVMEARKNRVDAAIVRILKARRTLEHSLLVAEVHKQLHARFSAEPQLIKRRIEALIEREYLERDKDDRRMYHYLA